MFNSEVGLVHVYNQDLVRFYFGVLWMYSYNVVCRSLMQSTEKQRPV